MHAPPPGAPPTWADAHNHLHDPRLAALIDENGVGEGPCLINATSEDDWDAVLQTAARAPGSRHAALGVHPWFAHLARPGWESRLRDHLQASPSLTIGESGLDGKTQACPLDIQIPIFEAQLRLARDLDRPLTIHCVAAWGRLFDCLTREPPPPRWMIHGFSGSVETAHRLVGMGAFLSIPVRALHPNGARILKVFASIPSERILLETDAPFQPPPVSCDGWDARTTWPAPPAPVLPANEKSIEIPINVGPSAGRPPHSLNHPTNLAAIGPAIAARLGIPPWPFAHLTYQNFIAFLG